MKFKRKLSVMLIVTMITSLFAGTIAAAPGKRQSEGNLFNKSPVILVTQEGEQIAQSFEIASPANAASFSNADLEATPAEAEAAIANMERDNEHGTIVITPKKTENTLPISGTISVKNDDITYRGDVSFKWNQLKNGNVEVEKGKSAIVEFIANASDATTATYTVDPSNSLKIEDTADKTGITITPIAGTNAKTATITMKSGSNVVGICKVTITESSEVVSSTFLKDKDGQVQVQVGKSADLSLTDYGKSVMASPSNAAKVEVIPVNSAIASVEKAGKGISVTGLSVGATDISVKYTDEAGKEKTDTCKITVTADEVPPDPTEPTGDFFDGEGKLVVVTGSLGKLPVKSEVLIAIAEKRATIISDNPDVADISDKSGSTICYVQGKKAGTATFRIEYDGKWDERTVEVINGKKETLFVISDKDKKVSVNAGEYIEIELTEKALELLEAAEEDTYKDVRTGDTNIAEAYFDEVSVCVSLYGVSEGETTLTFTIGDAVDICTVKVNRNYVKEMENALESVKDLDASNAVENKTAIEAAIGTIQNITSSMVKDNPEALNLMEDAETLEILNAQMEIIAKLEALLPIINPNIELPKPVVAQEVSDLIGVFECIGVGLSVDPNTTSKTTANLVVKTALAEVPDVTLSANAVALDITLDISGKEEQPLAPIKVTMGIPQALKGKDALAVYHVHNGSKTKFTPYTSGDTIIFYITKLSTFVIDEDNVETAKVMLKSAEGGYVSAYSKDVSGVRTYVPVGEMVSVPVGTELHFDEENVSWYRFKNITVKTGDNTTTLGREQIDSETVTITDQTTITPLFESRTPNPDYTTGYNIGYDKWWFMPGDMLVEQLYVYDDDDNKVTATEYEFDETGYEEPDIETIREYFDLTPDGKLTSKKPLPDDDFYFYIKCKINGKQYSSANEADGYYGDVSFDSGINVNFVYDWFKPKKNSNTIYHMWGDNENLSAPAAFGTISGSYNKMKMYGGYTFAGWYDSRMNLVGDDVMIDGPRSVFARFKKSDGSFYDPSGSGSTVNPTPPSSGSSGGRSGGSSYNTYTMHGSWQMTELGWKFRQNGGAFAQNQWGYINGAYYYFGADGIMMTGWVFVDNNWYYMNPTAGSVQGSRMTGWVADPTYNAWFYLNASGAMQTGWQLLDGKWYYLNPNPDGRRGTKLTSQWVGDYYLDENGVWVEGMMK